MEKIGFFPSHTLFSLLARWWFVECLLMSQLVE